MCQKLLSLAAFDNHLPTHYGIDHFHSFNEVLYEGNSSMCKHFLYEIIQPHLKSPGLLNTTLELVSEFAPELPKAGRFFVLSIYFLLFIT